MKKAVFSCYVARDQAGHIPGKDTAMSYSTAVPTPVARIFKACPAELAEVLEQSVVAIADLASAFRTQSPTPTTTYQWENDMAAHLRELGRSVVEWTLNHLEANDPQLMPMLLLWQGDVYRRKPKSCNRCLQSLFGPIRLWRQRYAAVDTPEPTIVPVEMALGIEAERATPALAERVGQAAALLPQSGVQEMLARCHGVRWSVQVLRKVTGSLSQGMAEHRAAAQAAKLVQALRQAAQSRGPHEPTITVGRDGVMVPLRGQQAYAEASTATVAVLDRRGRRLYTAYLGRMPEKEQGTLSQQLTSLLLLLLRLWQGALPRWQYLTDGGQAQTTYFRRVLRRMHHPLTGLPLCWEWTIDFYHASSYLSKLGEALYGASREALAWSAKMRHWLRHKSGGIQRLLYSAAAVRARRQLSSADAQAYGKAWNYLHKRKRRLDYAGNKSRGLAIGSGVTEAACKTVFTQRLKQSGMRWGVAGGQVIVDLRIVVLSQVWHETHQAYLASKPQVALATMRGIGAKTTVKIA